MTQPVYEATLYSRLIKYKDSKGEEKELKISFALDPIQLMRVITKVGLKTTKSKNPAKQNEPELSDDDQLRLLQDLASRSAGFPDEDDDRWIPMEDFGNHFAGMAFMTMLAASDTVRKDFAEKVILDPFRSFVAFAKADPANDPKETQNFDIMLKQMENVFVGPDVPNETLDDRKARLAAELALLEQNDE